MTDSLTMKKPEFDLENRKEVWDAMQMLYMDSDPDDELDWIAQVCAKSHYSLDELELILINEVFPACRFNLFMQTIPEWRGFEIDGLTQQIIKKNRHGKRKLWILTRYTHRWWKKLKPKIVALRVSC